MTHPAYIYATPAALLRAPSAALQSPTFVDVADYGKLKDDVARMKAFMGADPAPAAGGGGGPPKDTAAGGGPEVPDPSEPWANKRLREEAVEVGRPGRTWITARVSVCVLCAVSLRAQCMPGTHLQPKGICGRPARWNHTLRRMQPPGRSMRHLQTRSLVSITLHAAQLACPPPHRCLIVHCVCS